MAVLTRVLTTPGSPTHLCPRAGRHLRLRSHGKRQALRCRGGRRRLRPVAPGDLPTAVGTVNHATWWADVVPVALWLYLSLRLNPASAQARWRAAVLWTTAGAGALLILFGTATNLVNNYDHVPVSAGPAYAVYAAYVLLCTGFAVVNFVQMRRTNGYALAPVGAGYLPTIT